MEEDMSLSRHIFLFINVPGKGHSVSTTNYKDTKLPLTNYY
jgi:hypothetical protein